MNQMDRDLIFSRIKRAAKAEKAVIVSKLCEGKSVLDVGCAGQDFSPGHPGWLHKVIKGVARDLDGVDIEPAAISQMKEKGYSVFGTDELKLSDKKYQIVVIADVIEHVNDPVNFLKFYSSFLTADGKLIITTPNAHGIRNFTSILAGNNYSVNPQHTYWFCPKTMMEVTDRAGLTFADFFWLREYYSLSEVRTFKYKVIYILNRILQKLRSNFYPNFMYIVSK